MAHHRPIPPGRLPRNRASRLYTPFPPSIAQQPTQMQTHRCPVAQQGTAHANPLEASPRGHSGRDEQCSRSWPSAQQLWCPNLATSSPGANEKPVPRVPMPGNSPEPSPPTSARLFDPFEKTGGRCAADTQTTWRLRSVCRASGCVATADQRWAVSREGAGVRRRRREMAGSGHDQTRDVQRRSERRI